MGSFPTKAEFKIKVSDERKENENPYGREELAEIPRALRLESGSRGSRPGPTRDEMHPPCESQGLRLSMMSGAVLE